MTSKYRTNRIHEIAVDPQGLQDANPHSLLAGFAGGPSGLSLVKAVVLEVFFDPTIIDQKKAESMLFAEGKKNAGRFRRKIKKSAHLLELPRNSILVQLVNDGSNPTSEPEYMLPFFPSHLMLPVKAGEHVWVYRDESRQIDYGFWLCRVSEPRYIEDANFTHADRKLDQSIQPGTIDLRSGAAQNPVPAFNNGAVVKTTDGYAPAGETASLPGGEDAYNELLKDTDSAKVTDFEAVPRFTKRPADFALQGSNNTLIVMGTDRSGAAAEYVDTDDGKSAKGRPSTDQTGGAGSIDIVVGRGKKTSKKKPKEVKNSLENTETDKKLVGEDPNEGDPDFAEDAARFYLSMKTALDDNFNINLSKISRTNTGNTPTSGAAIKADNVRIIARKELRLLIQPEAGSDPSDCAAVVIKASGDIVFIPSSKGVIKLGGDDAKLALLATDAGTVNTGGTVSAPPIISTMGGVIGSGGPHGLWATKILVK